MAVYINGEQVNGCTNYASAVSCVDKDGNPSTVQAEIDKQKAKNEDLDLMKVQLNGIFFGIDGDGNYGYYRGDGTLIPFSGGKAHSIYCELIINDNGAGCVASATLYVDGENKGVAGSSSSWVYSNISFHSPVVAVTDSEEHEVYIVLQLHGIGNGCKVSAKLYIDNVAKETIGTPLYFTGETQTWTSSKYNLNKAYWGS